MKISYVLFTLFPLANALLFFTKYLFTLLFHKHARESFYWKLAIRIIACHRRQAIVRILVIRPLGTNFNEIWTEIPTFPFKKMHLKTYEQTNLDVVEKTTR